MNVSDARNRSIFIRKMVHSLFTFPEYPAACNRYERQGDPRRSSIERWRVRATAQFHFDTPQPACWSAAEISFTGLRGVSLQFDSDYDNQLHIFPSSSRPAFAKSSGDIAILNSQSALNFKKKGSAKDGTLDESTTSMMATAARAPLCSTK